MAKYDHQAVTIADSYARTLLDLSEAQGASDTILEEVEEILGGIDRDAAFAAFLTGEAIDDDRRAEALEKYFRGRASDLMVNALQVINRKGRCDLIPLIFERYRLALEQLRKQIEVEVISAVPLTDALRAQLRDAVQAVAQKTPLLVEKVDPAILGGLIVRVGDEKMDSSVTRRLEQLGAALHERALHEIHSEKPYYDGVGG